jgi:16S rRNA G966 N2-methylase RsmD
MATAPLPDGAPPDLMLPFGAIPDEAGRDIILSGDHADAALAYCRDMGAQFGAPGYMRYLFGLPVNEALRSGYRITQRALRETTPHACAEEIARTVLELLPDADSRTGTGRSVLNLFAGVGQMAYSYAGAGCRVQSVENDSTTAGVGAGNMALAGLSGDVEYLLADAPAALAGDASAGREFSVVHLDPPWQGSYQYDLARPFMLEDLAFDVGELVRLGLDIAPVVVLSLPHNAAVAQIGELAARTGCRAVVQYQFIADFPASFSQAPAYFYGHSGAGHDGAGGVGGVQERHQRLTVDGRRAA